MSEEKEDDKWIARRNNVVNKISNKSGESFAFVGLLFTQGKNATYFHCQSDLCNMHAMYMHRLLYAHSLVRYGEGGGWETARMRFMNL